MNYNKLYSKFIESRPLRKKKSNDGLEVHHILPRCLGGNNKKENLIALTPREHFIAHIILTKCYSGSKRSKMVYALMRLTKGNGFKLSSKRYEIIKKLASQNQSKRMKRWFKENREQFVEFLKNRNIDWKKHKESHNTSEYRELMKQRAEENWNNPDYIKKQRTGLKKKDYSSIYTKDICLERSKWWIKHTNKRKTLKNRPICPSCNTNQVCSSGINRFGTRSFRKYCTLCEKQMGRRGKPNWLILEKSMIPNHL